MVLIELAGADISARVRVGTLVIHDGINDAPNNCTFTMQGAAPDVAQRLVVTIDGAREFVGTIQTVQASYVGRPPRVVYHCTGIDDAWQVNRRLVLGEWEEASACAIIAEMVATYAPGFTGTLSCEGLPLVKKFVLQPGESFTSALGRLAALTGASFYVDDGAVHFFPGVDPSGEEPEEPGWTPLTVEVARSVDGGPGLPVTLTQAPFTTTDNLGAVSVVYGINWLGLENLPDTTEMIELEYDIGMDYAITGNTAPGQHSGLAVFYGWRVPNPDPEAYWLDYGFTDQIGLLVGTAGTFTRWTSGDWQGGRLRLMATHGVIAVTPDFGSEEPGSSTLTITAIRITNARWRYRPVI